MTTRIHTRRAWLRLLAALLGMGLLGGAGAIYAQSTPAPSVCDRTPKVRDAILAKIGGDPACAAVTTAQLAAMTGTLRVPTGTTGLGSTGGVSAGDFAGLTGIQKINLSGSFVNLLPANLFGGLTALEEIDLSNNYVYNLPADLFSGLTTLRKVDLSLQTNFPFNSVWNGVTSVPATLFNGLTALEEINLSQNLFTTLPANVFNGLTALKTIDLSLNPLSNIAASQFSGLTALQNINLAGNNLSTIAANQFSGLTALQSIDLANNDLTSIAADQFDGLTELRILALNKNDLASIAANQFSGLTQLRSILLQENNLASIAADQFNGLTALETINLTYNNINQLPVELWRDSLQLREVRLSNNPLGDIPDGFLVGLSALNTLWIHVDTGSSFNRFTLTAQLEALDGQRGRVVVPWGAPFNMTFGLTAGDGTITAADGTVIDRIAVATGARHSELFTVSGADTVTITTVPNKPTCTFFPPPGNGHCGYRVRGVDAVLQLSPVIVTPLQLELNETGAGNSSTYSVVLAAAPTTAVTITPTSGDTGIATIATANGMGTLVFGTATGAGGWDTAQLVTVTAVADDQNIAAPRTVMITHADDDDTSAWMLDAVMVSVANSATRPPTDTPVPSVCDRSERVRTAILARLANTVGEVACNAVTKVQLAAMAGTLSLVYIDSVRAGDFNDLTGVQTLDLSNNRLTTLPDGLFAELTAVTEINLNGNELTTLAVNTFSGLTTLSVLNLANNALTTIPAQIFAGLSALQALHLNGNGLTQVAANQFSGLTALQRLYLSANDLTSVDENQFSGLTQLRMINLSDNQLSTVAANQFSGFPDLIDVDVSSNRLTSIPATLFTGSTALQAINLHANQLANMPDNALQGLVALQELRVSANPQLHLPDGWLAGLPALTTLAVYPAVGNVRDLAVHLVADANEQIRVAVAWGAPFAMTFGLTVDGSPRSSITVAPGALMSEPFTISGNQVAFTTLPAVPNCVVSSYPEYGHCGYRLVPDATPFVLRRASIGLFDAMTGGNAVTHTPLDLNTGRVDDAYFVRLTAAPVASVTIRIASDSPRVQFVTAQNTTAAMVTQLDFTAANWYIGQSVTTVFVETNAEMPNRIGETFTIEHSVSSGDATFGPVTLTGTFTQVGLVFADSADSITTALDLTEGEQGQYQVKLREAPTAPVTLTMTPRGALSVSPLQLHFTTTANGTRGWDVYQPVTVTAAHDDDTDDDSAVVGHRAQGGNYTGFTADFGWTITDDDTAAVRLSTTKLLAAEGATTATYTIVLQTRPRAPVTIMVSSDMPTVATVPESVYFTVADWHEAKTVTVTLHDDAIANPNNRTATVSHTARSDDTEYHEIPIAPVTVELTDNDVVAIRLSPTHLFVEPNNEYTYTVVLASQPSAAVTVHIETPSDIPAGASTPAVTVVPRQLDFTTVADDPSGYGWNESQTVTVRTDAAVPAAVTVTHTATGASAYANLPAVELVAQPRAHARAVNAVVVPQVARAVAGQWVGAISARTSQVLRGAPRRANQVIIGGQNSFAQAVLAHAPSLTDGTHPLREILGGSSFVIPLTMGRARARPHTLTTATGSILAGVPRDEIGADENPALPTPPAAKELDTTTPRPATRPRTANNRSAIAAWGGFDYLNMEGDGGAGNGAISWDGNLTSIHLGVDGRLANGGVLGLAVARSRSQLAYRNARGHGAHNLRLTSLHPYYAWQATSGQSGWVSLGLGRGDLSVGGATAKTNMRVFGVGGSGAIGGDQAETRWQGEFVHSRMTVTNELAARVNGQRLRFSVERSAARPHGDGELTPTVAAGLRHDAGNGATGTGLELTGRLRYTNAVTGVTTEGRMHALVGRANYDEWGVAGMVRVAPNAAGRGLLLSLQPQFGNTDDRIAMMWRENWGRAPRTHLSNPAAARVAMRLDYGFGRNGILVTPYQEIIFAQATRDRRHRLGFRWRTSHAELHLHGMRQPTADGRDHRFMLQGRIRF